MPHFFKKHPKPCHRPSLPNPNNQKDITGSKTLHYQKQIMTFPVYEAYFMGTATLSSIHRVACSYFAPHSRWSLHCCTNFSSQISILFICIFTSHHAVLCIPRRKRCSRHHPRPLLSCFRYLAEFRALRVLMLAHAVTGTTDVLVAWTRSGEQRGKNVDVWDWDGGVSASPDCGIVRCWYKVWR